MFALKLPTSVDDMDIVDESSKRPASSLVSEDTNPRKKHKVGTHLFSDPFSLVTFVIGSEKKQFLVHKQVACHSSEVLNAAFNGDFIEGQTQTYILNDVTDNAFTLVTQWMYFQKFDFPKLDGDPLQPHQQKIGMLLETWVVAGKLLMSGLQNAALNELEGQEFHITNEYLGYIYDNTSEDCQLRKYIIAVFATYLSREEWTQREFTNLESVPSEFLFDIIRYHAPQPNQDSETVPVISPQDFLY